MSVINKRKVTCSGCNACAEACPKHCIEMVPDRKGFLYPKVNEVVCIDCGVCERVCPFEDGNKKLNVPLTAYAAWNKDREQHLGSSSGGAAYVFSSYIIKQGGIVYGCTSEGMHIRHIRVASLSELPQLQGSKYVQSDVRGIFSQVKIDLKAEKPVLFIGTPCQVAGLKNYIRTVPPHLFLVDLICHGVPSQKMLSAHIAPISKGRKVEHIAFRYGTTFMMKITGKDFSYECMHYWKDSYMRSFMDGFTYRKSCYQCPFATSNRVGDVTIGDFWGLNGLEEQPAGTHGGISVLLPCTEKGQELIRSLANKLVLHERQVTEAVDGNTQLRHPMYRSFNNRIFNILWPLLPFDKAVWLPILLQRMNTLIKILLDGVRK